MLPALARLCDRAMRGHPVMELGLAHLTALDLPPPELIKAAGRAGFRSVGLRVHPAMPGAVSYPTRIGSQAHRELADILKSEGVRLNEIECFQLTPDVDVRRFEPLLAAGADLGAVAVTMSGDDPDERRLTTQFRRPLRSRTTIRSSRRYRIHALAPCRNIAAGGNDRPRRRKVERVDPRRCTSSEPVGRHAGRTEFDTGDFSARRPALRCGG